MRIPKPVYERFPQVYFLIGLLLMADGLYLGFENVLAFYYIGFGLISCCYGVAIFMMRLQNRQDQSPAQATATTADTSASVEKAADTSDASIQESSHEPTTQH